MESSYVKDLFLNFTQQDIDGVFSRIRLFPEHFDLSGIDEDPLTRLSIIKERVNELMKRVSFLNFPSTDPKELLRMPYRFFRLMESLPFVDLSVYDRLSPDEAGLQQKEVADYVAQTKAFNDALLREGARLRLPEATWFLNCCKSVSTIQKPFPSRLSLVRAVQLCAKSTEERGTFFEIVQQASPVAERDFFDLEGRDAGRLFRLASSYPEYFGVLPSEEEADYARKRATVRDLCWRVQKLMKQVPVPFGDSPENVLRTPYRFLRLMQTLYFADADQRREDVMTYAKHSTVFNQADLQVALLASPRRARTLCHLQERIYDLFQGLSQQQEDERPLLKKMVEVCTASVEERGCLRSRNRPGEPLFEFKRKELEEALCLVRTSPEHFSSVLPENNPLYRILDHENTREVLCELENRISEHIKSAKPFGFPYMDPKRVLQEPSRFFRLVESLRLVKYTEERLLQYAKQAQNLNQEVLQLTERLSISDAGMTLFPAYQKLSFLLEKTPPAAAEIIEWCLVAVEDRGDLYPAIREALKKRRETLESFSGPLPRFVRPSILETSPPVVLESDWIQKAHEYLKEIKPLLMIVQETQEFLRPYLEGKITAETEDVSRPEIISWLPKKIREKFPGAVLQGSEVEAISLTAYLRAGFSHFHLEKPKEVLSCIEQRTQKDREESFTQALMHALPIDFQSARLSIEDIRGLTSDFFDNPEAFVSTEWLGGHRQPTEPTAQRTRAGSP